ncbi:MAG: Xaa-Pro peptidase family protein [Actinobacteria bacterium]|nr:Xaa-Pro peptidase family protein [Actinomycetota bacterium]
MDDSLGLGAVDLDLLRTERLGRLQSAMRGHGLEACLLFSEPNARYATGVTAMPIWSMSTFTRCAVVPAEGDPILFEHGNSVHRSALRAADVRPMHGWEFFDDAPTHAGVFAKEAVAALRELGVDGSRVGVDRIGMPGLLALQDEGLTLVDSSPATQEAREVKTSQEVLLFRLNGQLVVEGLSEFEAALTPGIRERELFAVFASGMLSRGAEYLATNTVCSGPNTNPWRAEATERVFEAGDLVYIDTDTVGVEGCFFCVSRAFVCGDLEPTAKQRETYRVAHDWVRGMTELVRPGITCAELAAAAPKIPERFLPQRYEVMIHSVGLEEESPSVCHPQDVQSNPDRVIQENMALVVEIYVGEVGGSVGVKFGDEILVTADGAEILAPYPYSTSLLA